MVRPLFFRASEWEVAQIVSIHATTRPRYLYHSELTEEGHPEWQHWIGKNPQESGFPYIIANEFICARLAAEVGLLVPECQIQFIGEKTWFLSRYIEHESFTYQKFSRCRNIGDIPLLLLFDLWVCNTDRWASNLLISRIGDAPDVYELVIIDHSHALFGEAGLLKASLDIDPRLCFTLPELTEQITKDSDWDSPLSKVESLNEKVISEVINSLPHTIRNEFNTNLLSKQIARRGEQLRGLLHHARTMGCFPKWS